MTIAGELVNILGFRLEGQENLKKFNKGMDDAEAKAKANSERVKNLGRAAGVATTAMIALGTKGYKNFAAFETSMVRIGITAGATTKQVMTAGDEVRRLASQVALPVSEAVSALDTLTASGMNLEDAMAFLPSVLATAQASGAATEDIANTALKAAAALNIEAKDMQTAFDIMVAGGKAGQFELKDMASFIPNLANSFANLGYEGQEGLQKLIAILQTLRTTTGDASSAATNAGEIFGKMYSPQVVKSFKKLGIDIKKEMDSAKKSGEDLMKAYVRLADEALKKNPKATIVDLFSDKQMREGMLTLMRMGDAWRDFDSAVTNSDVAGGTLRDLNTVLDTQDAKLQKLSNSWDQFLNSVGASVSGPVGGALDAVSKGLDQADFIDAALRKQGKGFLGISAYHLTTSPEEKGRFARENGYAPTAADKEIQKNAPRAYKVLGRYPQRPNSTVSTAAMGAPQRETMDVGGSSKAIFDQIAAMNSNLANMAQTTGAGATVTDARQDNRQFPMNVNAPVTVNVASPTSAPAALGAAVGAAIGQAATAQQSRIESEPAQP